MNYLKIAISAAVRAGYVHRKYFEKNIRIRNKSTSFDLVTVADVEAEREAVSFIRKNFPSHNILAEEKKYNKTLSEYTWVIDPLDGTNNFACTMPIFCSSVALRLKDEIIVGAVYDVSRNELFYAQKGKGAFLNGKRISVNNAKRLGQALLITGFYYSRGREMTDTLKAIELFFRKKILGIRRLGAAALDMCYVACGRASGFWEFELSPWDYSAGKLIIEEAGGRVTGKYGENIPLSEKHFIVSSNGKIHKDMLKVIGKIK
ncbi:MAG: inositol monophosphatase [Candidatus Omnitrophota bacterium]|jgi:myo-inositol-1(or 4)-monophosphatase|nr:MAG: inositol monophosphatase [Candidatus Omnitrophota bacterium]